MIERQPGNHVTDILAAVGMSDGAHIPKDKLAYYLRRGSAIHEATALYDRGALDEDSLDPEIAPYLEAWKAFRREVGGVILAVELFLRHSALDYCGTLDRIIGPSKVCPRRLLLDIKTTEAAAAARIQTAAYIMLCGGEPMQRGAVALKANGRYELDLYDDDARDFEAWIACLTIAAWKRKHGANAEHHARPERT